jgi:ribonuclease HI
MKNKFIIHTDGGARGNPGPAAIGFVIEGPDSAIAGGKKENMEYIGETTNNDAEYQAVIKGLKKLKSLIGGGKASEAKVEVLLDSELVERQMNRKYKIKNGNLQNLFVETWNLCLDFGEVSFKHVRREQNAGADKLVNQALDLESSRLKI